MTDRNCVMVAGFAEVPKGTSLYEVYKIISCVLVVDVDDQTIQQASFSFVMEKTSEFISQQLQGMSIANGIEEAKEKLCRSMLIPGQKAVLCALQQAYERYCEMN